MTVSEILALWMQNRMSYRAAHAELLRAGCSIDQASIMLANT